MCRAGPTLRAGVVTVRHAAPLRYEGAGGAGGAGGTTVLPLPALPAPRVEDGPRVGCLTGQACPDGFCELRLTADSFKLGPADLVKKFYYTDVCGADLSFLSSSSLSTYFMQRIQRKMIMKQMRTERTTVRNITSRPTIYMSEVITLNDK